MTRWNEPMHHTNDLPRDMQLSRINHHIKIVQDYINYSNSYGWINGPDPHKIIQATRSIRWLEEYFKIN